MEVMTDPRNYNLASSNAYENNLKGQQQQKSLPVNVQQRLLDFNQRLEASIGGRAVSSDYRSGNQDWENERNKYEEEIRNLRNELKGTDNNSRLLHHNNNSFSGPQSSRLHTAYNIDHESNLQE